MQEKQKRRPFGRLFVDTVKSGLTPLVYRFQQPWQER